MKKTIVIMGAGAGVGMAVAERFGTEGYNVALLARSKDKLECYVAELKEKGIQAQYYPADVLNGKSLIDVLIAVKKEFGTIDVVEFSQLAPMDTVWTPRNVTIDNLQYHLDFLLLSAVAVVQHLLPEMLERKSGSFLFTSAPTAQRPMCMTGSYGIVAGALLNYVRLLNKDLAGDNIFAGIVGIAGVVYNGDEPDAAVKVHLPEGIPFVAAKEVAEAHWQLHTRRKNVETFVGDVDKLYSMPGFY